MSGESLFKSIVSGENQVTKRLYQYETLDLMREKVLLELLYLLLVLVTLPLVVLVKRQW